MVGGNGDVVSWALEFGLAQRNNCGNQHGGESSSCELSHVVLDGQVSGYSVLKTLIPHCAN